MKKYKNKSMYLALAVLLFLIGIGYAVLTANLSINGTSGIANATWDVHFENPNPTANSNVTPSVAPAADPNDKVQSISYTVTFNQPGDVYEFTVDVANRGSIDAMINSITSTYKIGDAEAVDLTQNDLPAYLDYYVTYSDGVELAQKQRLVHGTTEKLVVHVEFKRNITNAQYEGAVGKSIVFTYELEYIQTDGSEIEVNHPVCMRVTDANDLHTATCNAGYGCINAEGIGDGGKIIYGTAKELNSVLNSGDAFDCDVNNNGKIDRDVNGKSTERFYYVTGSGSGKDEIATLIYYTCVTGGTTESQTGYSYDAQKTNFHGPRTAYVQLPSLTQWSNSGLIAPGTRQMTNEIDGITTDNGSRTIEEFTYTDRAARFLTYQEVYEACGESNYLDGCNYFLENLGQYEGTTGLIGYWLETPYSSNGFQVRIVYANLRSLSGLRTDGSLGIRPAISVLKSKILS